MSNWLGSWSGIIAGLDTRVLNLEDTVNEYEVYENIASGTTGTITKPLHGTIILDQYPQAADCLILKKDSVTGKPIDSLATTSLGIAITATFDVNGNYVLSGTPSAYPVAIVYQLRLAEKYKTAELGINSILNEMQKPAILAGTTVAPTPTGLAENSVYFKYT